MRWITTDNIRRETWAQLLDFANTELCYERIARLHGAPASDRTRANYRKQASQIRVALLQAREYFRAADVATVVTRPNLLYYGMVSLASAAMLLRGSGEYSLDRLRRNTANKSHGLSFTTGINTSGAETGTTLLDQSHVEILANGFFLNWYRHCRPTEHVYAKTSTHSRTTTEVSMEIGGVESREPPEKMIGYKVDLTSLIADLPELLSDVTAAGIRVSASRLDYEVTKRLAEGEIEYEWRIHGTRTSDALANILEAFATPSASMECLRVFPEEPTSHCIVRISGKSDEISKLGFKFPAVRMDMNGQQVIYGKQNFRMPEYVQQFMFMYALSMFARYWPDLWMHCIDSHCKAARLIERAITEIEKKFPIHVLGLLAGEDVFITTHRPTWH